MASEGAIIPQLVESITQSSSPSTATCSVPMAGGDISSSAHTTIPCQTELVLDERIKKELFTDTFCRVCGAVLQFESHRNAHYEGKKHAQKVRLYFLNKELEEMAYRNKMDQKVDRINSRLDQQLGQDQNKFCSLCNMVFSSPVVAQSHYVGKIHAKKLKQLSVDGEWAAEANDSSATTAAEKAVPPVSEQETVMSPLSEKSNQQEASTEPSPAPNNEIDLSDPNKYCKLCCASFNNPLVAQQHYNGKKHARNELRRKLMEEMEDTGLSVDSGGDGVYVCPICSVTLTSIEMYQSHMQGNKHQIKENIVANLMKTTKKSYDSFENELEDYIKVQKARGLVPKTQFRPDKDQLDSAEEAEPPPNPIPYPAAYKYPAHKTMPYPAYNPLHTNDHRMAAWEPPYRPPKLTRMPVKPAPPPRRHPPSSPDPSDDYSSSDSGDSYKKEKRHRREHRSKERKRHGRSKRENGSSEKKRRKIDESDSGKEDSDKEKRSDPVDKPAVDKPAVDKPAVDKSSADKSSADKSSADKSSADKSSADKSSADKSSADKSSADKSSADKSSVDKSKHKKDKRKKEELSADKESRKHKKPKRVEAAQRTEEEMLWDESILGF